jgi:lysophospholipase L1-like esterase
LTRRGALLTAATGGAALLGAHSRLPHAMVVFGDSWAAGLHADPAHALGQVAAARLGWSVTVDAASGTGYVKGFDDELSYVDRVGDLPRRGGIDVVLLQGGSNDKDEPPDLFDQAVRQTLHLVEHRLPGAQRLILGPGPDPMPVTDDQLAIDRRLMLVAAAEGAQYVSMLKEGWITPSRHARAIDPQNHHPTVAGQQYLGRRLAASLRRMYPALTAAAAG